MKTLRNMSRNRITYSVFKFSRKRKDEWEVWMFLLLRSIVKTVGD